jgi:F420-non-reducing hydrogenase iron-sulfur subunit
MSWEPKILGILCNWCSYQGADLAGTSRMAYAPNLRIVRVMCSGRVEPLLILSALRSGADGVLVAGCHPGDCHYSDGNHKTRRRLPLLKAMLSQMGVEEGRVELAWVSAAEADVFVKVVNELTERVRALGPFREAGRQPAAAPLEKPEKKEAVA